MTAKLEVETVLVVSIGHMTERDNELLSPPDRSPGVYRAKYDEGYFVFTGLGADAGSMDKDLGDDGYSSSFRSVLALGRSRGCRFVRFDSDGPKLEGFLTFDW